MSEHPRVYVASKSRYGGLWQEFRSAWVGHAVVTSTWIDEYQEGASGDLTDLWRRCVAEVQSSDLLIAAYEPGDEWKGAFVEIGVALASDVPVYAIGRPPGSWIHHPLVTLAADPDDALCDFTSRRSPSELPS